MAKPKIRGWILILPKPKPVYIQPWIIDGRTRKLLKALGIPEPKPPHKVNKDSK
jgi:hypothetical protein